MSKMDLKWGLGRGRVEVLVLRLRLASSPEGGPSLLVGSLLKTMLGAVFLVTKRQEIITSHDRVRDYLLHLEQPGAVVGNDGQVPGAGLS